MTAKRAPVPDENHYTTPKTSEPNSNPIGEVSGRGFLGLFAAVLVFPSTTTAILVGYCLIWKTTGGSLNPIALVLYTGLTLVVSSIVSVVLGASIGLLVVRIERQLNRAAGLLLTMTLAVVLGILLTATFAIAGIWLFGPPPSWRGFELVAIWFSVSGIVASSAYNLVVGNISVAPLLRRTGWSHHRRYIDGVL